MFEKDFFQNTNNSFNGTARNFLYFKELLKVISFDNICFLSSSNKSVAHISHGFIGISCDIIGSFCYVPLNFFAS